MRRCPSRAHRRRPYFGSSVIRSLHSRPRRFRSRGRDARNYMRRRVHRSGYRAREPRLRARMVAIARLGPTAETDVQLIRFAAAETRHITSVFCARCGAHHPIVRFSLSRTGERRSYRSVAGRETRDSKLTRTVLSRPRGAEPRLTSCWAVSGLEKPLC